MLYPHQIGLISRFRNGNLAVRILRGQLPSPVSLFDRQKSRKSRQVGALCTSRNLWRSKSNQNSEFFGKSDQYFENSYFLESGSGDWFNLRLRYRLAVGTAKIYFERPPHLSHDPVKTHVGGDRNTRF
jgi:hypothetical protein